jgi:hypothetical protein
MMMPSARAGVGKRKDSKRNKKSAPPAIWSLDGLYFEW